MAGGRPAKYQRTAFGERLVFLRQERGLSQAQTAERLNVTQQAYAGWERSTTALKPDDIVKLANAFEITTDELLGKETLQTKTNGPVGKARKIFEEVNSLPRHQQQKIIDTIEVLLAGTKVKQAS